MSKPILIGQTGVHDHHTGGRISVADTTRKTFVKQGLYADLERMLPKKGGRFEGLRVVSAELVRAKGGMGMLTVVCNRKRGGAATAEGGGADEIVYEVDVAQLEKPLLSHPDYSAYAGQIEMWREGDPAMRAAMRYRDEDGAEQELDGKAEKVAKLLLNGVESYLVFAPVVRRTTRVSDAAEDTWKGEIGRNAGKRVRPPAAGLRMVSGSWMWLKTADRAAETAGGGAERVEEWTGADEWDEDLYKEGFGN